MESYSDWKKRKNAKRAKAPKDVNTKSKSSSSSKSGGASSNRSTKFDHNLAAKAKKEQTAAAKAYIAGKSASAATAAQRAKTKTKPDPFMYMSKHQKEYEIKRRERAKGGWTKEEEMMDALDYRRAKEKESVDTKRDALKAFQMAEKTYQKAQQNGSKYTMNLADSYYKKGQTLERLLPHTVNKAEGAKKAYDNSVTRFQKSLEGSKTKGKVQGQYAPGRVLPGQTPAKSKLGKALENTGLTLQAGIESAFGGIAGSWATGADAAANIENNYEKQRAQIQRLVDGKLTKTEEEMGLGKYKGDRKGATEYVMGNAAKNTSNVNEAYKAVDKITEKAAADTEEAKKNAQTKAGKVAVDLGVQMGKMGTEMAIGGGAGRMAVMVNEVFGMGANQARREGAPLEKQIAYGVAEAAKEYWLERIGGGLGKAFGAKGFTDDLVEGIASKITSRVARNLFRFGADMVGEAFEEGLADIAEPAVQAIYNGDDAATVWKKTWSKDNLSDALYDSLIGGLMGGIFSGGQAFTGRLNARDAELMNELRKHTITTEDGKKVNHVDFIEQKIREANDRGESADVNKIEKAWRKAYTAELANNKSEIKQKMKNGLSREEALAEMHAGIPESESAAHITDFSQRLIDAGIKNSTAVNADKVITKLIENGGSEEAVTDEELRKVIDDLKITWWQRGKKRSNAGNNALSLISERLGLDNVAVASEDAENGPAQKKQDADANRSRLIKGMRQGAQNILNSKAEIINDAADTINQENNRRAQEEEALKSQTITIDGEEYDYEKFAQTLRTQEPNVDEQEIIAEWAKAIQQFAQQEETAPSEAEEPVTKEEEPLTEEAEEPAAEEPEEPELTDDDVKRNVFGIGEEQTPEDYDEMQELAAKGERERRDNSFRNLIPPDSYVNGEEYQNNDRIRVETANRLKELEEERKQLREELKKESFPKPKEEWNADDEIEALFVKAGPQKYTERGEEINKRIKDIDAKIEALEKTRDEVGESFKKQRTEISKEQAKQWVHTKPEETDQTEFDYFLNDTGVPYAEEARREGRAYVAMMSPKEYFMRCAFDIFADYNTTYDHQIEALDPEAVAKYTEDMANGTKYYMPYLNYKNAVMGQEGRHRAAAAYNLGVEKMPVLIIDYETPTPRSADTIEVAEEFVEDELENIEDEELLEEIEDEIETEPQQEEKTEPVEEEKTEPAREEKAKKKESSEDEEESEKEVMPWDLLTDEELDSAVYTDFDGTKKTYEEYYNEEFNRRDETERKNLLLPGQIRDSWRYHIWQQNEARKSSLGEQENGTEEEHASAEALVESFETMVNEIDNALDKIDPSLSGSKLTPEIVDAFRNLGPNQETSFPAIAEKIYKKLPKNSELRKDKESALASINESLAQVYDNYYDSETDNMSVEVAEEVKSESKPAKEKPKAKKAKKESKPKATYTKTAVNAVKRIIKYSPKEDFKHIMEKDGVYYATDGYRMVRLKEDIPELPHTDKVPKTTLELFDGYFNGDKYDASEQVDLPSKDRVAKFKRWLKENGNSSQTAIRITDELYVNANYLQDVLQVFPDAEGYIGRPEKGVPVLILKSEKGDAVIMPIKVDKEHPHPQPSESYYEDEGQSATKDRTPANVSALKKILNNNSKNNVNFRGIFEIDGKHIVTDGRTMLRLNEDVPALPRSPSLAVPISKDKIANAFSEENYDFTESVDLPTNKEILAFKKWVKDEDRDPLTPIQLADDLYVNAEYLQNIIKAYPDAQGFIMRPREGITGISKTPMLYVKSTKGDGILISVQPKTAISYPDHVFRNGPADGTSPAPKIARAVYNDEANAQKRKTLNRINNAERVLMDAGGKLPPYSRNLTRNNDGGIVTKNQETYYKDSVVRNSNGNLAVVYPTEDGGYTTIAPNEEGARETASYANLTNPGIIEGDFRSTEDVMDEVYELMDSDDTIDGVIVRNVRVGKGLSTDIIFPANSEQARSISDYDVGPKKQVVSNPLDAFAPATEEVAPSDKESSYFDEVFSRIKKRTGEPDAKVRTRVESRDKGNILDRWIPENVNEDAKKTKRNKSAYNIIQSFREHFGIYIDQGPILRRGVSGYYVPETQEIRSKVHNNLPTVCHELGHHLDMTYFKGQFGDGSLIESMQKSGNQEAADAIQEIIDNAPKGFLDSYKDNEHAREAFAEYIREYLLDSDATLMRYPKFTKYFMNTISKNDRYAINNFADDVNDYFSLSANDAQDHIVTQADLDDDLTPFRKRLIKRGRKFYQDMVDANHAIKIFDDKFGGRAHMLASIAPYSRSQAANVVSRGVYDAEGNYVGGSLVAALRPIKGKQANKDFSEYLVVKHGQERLKTVEGYDVFKDDPRKNNVKWMAERQAELEKQHPEFVAASEAVYQFIHDVNKAWGVDTGLISQSSIDSWDERWQYYVPFQRRMDDDRTGRGSKDGFANQTSGIHGLRGGSGRQIIDPITSIINYTVNLVNAGVRNNVMRELTATATNADGNTAAFLIKVRNPTKRTDTDTTEYKDEARERLLEFNLTVEEADDVLSVIPDVIQQYNRAPAKEKGLVQVMINGDVQTWKVTDPLLLDSLAGMTPPRRPTWVRAYQAASRFIVGNITGSNVLWSLTSNFPRDLVTYMTYAKTMNPLELFGNLGSAYANKFAGSKLGHAMGLEASDYYEEYLAMGGNNMSYYSGDPGIMKDVQEAVRPTLMKTYLNPMTYIEWLANTIEMGPRYATYKTLREKGLDAQTAFHGSADITVNFSRGGKVARELNILFPFFNASIQGVDKFGRWLLATDIPKADRSEASARRFFGWIATNAIGGALMWGLNGGFDDDKEKKDNFTQLSNYTKNSYWTIPASVWGDDEPGKYICIPKAREINVLASLIADSLAYHQNDDKEAYKEFGEYVTDNFFPSAVAAALQGVTSDVDEGLMQIGGSIGVVGQLFYYWANRDFLGRPITPSYLENKELTDQYKDSTTKLAVKMSEILNEYSTLKFSPIALDFFMQNSLGMWWKMTKALAPMNPDYVDKTLGIKNQYLKYSTSSTDVVDKFYDAREMSNRHRASHPDDINAVIESKMYDSMATFYSNYNSLIKGMPADQQRVAKQQMIDMIKDFQDGMEQKKYSDVQKKMFEYFGSIDNSENMPQNLSPKLSTSLTIKSEYSQKTNKSEHDLTAKQYYEYQTQYLDSYYNNIGKLLNTDWSGFKYQGMTAEDKKAILDKAVGYTKAAVKDTTDARLAKAWFKEDSNEGYLLSDLDAMKISLTDFEYVRAAVQYMEDTQIYKQYVGETVKESKKVFVADYIDHLPRNYSPEQKSWLFFNMGENWSMSGEDQLPWNGGTIKTSKASKNKILEEDYNYKTRAQSKLPGFD